jgi:hypothetical protein
MARITRSERLCDMDEQTHGRGSPESSCCYPRHPANPPILSCSFDASDQRNGPGSPKLPEAVLQSISIPNSLGNLDPPWTIQLIP